MKARAILITGAPGSGKTTLGRGLAAELRVPFIARDDIRGGLLFTAGAWQDELDHVPSGDDAVQRFLEVVEALLHGGVSCVIEYVVRAHRPEDLDRIRAAGDCVVIVVGCDDPMARVVTRNGSDRLIANPAVLAAAGVETVAEHTAATVARMRQVEAEMMVEFPVPRLDVDTTAGFEPDLDSIVEFATRP